MTTEIELYLHPSIFLPVWSVHPTILYDPLLFRAEGAEQAGRVCGGGQRRHPGVLGTRRPSENMTFRFMFHEVKHAKHAVPLKRSWDNDIISNNDNIKDGIEDANHNGRIDGDNGDGYYADTETWEETDPYEDDSDGDTFSDSDEKSWGYNPLSKDTDDDGLDDNEEDTANFGTWDASNETNAKVQDTDGDGLIDSFEINGWEVIILYEGSCEVIEQYQTYSDPLVVDYDEDGLTDYQEYENGCDPNENDTDEDTINDYDELNSKLGCSPIAKDGKPPTIIDFNCEYDGSNNMGYGKFKIPTKLLLKISIKVEDLFGLKNLNIDIKNLPNKEIKLGGLPTYNDSVVWSIIGYNDVKKAIFDGFSINISISDLYGNIGWKEQKLDSISKIVIEAFIGELVSIAKEIGKLVLDVSERINNFITKIIKPVVTKFFERNDKIINTIKDKMALFFISIKEGNMLQNIVEIVFDAFSEFLNIFESVIKKAVRWTLNIFGKDPEKILNTVGKISKIIADVMKIFEDIVSEFAKVFDDALQDIFGFFFKDSEKNNGYPVDESLIRVERSKGTSSDFYRGSYEEKQLANWFGNHEKSTVIHDSFPAIWTKTAGIMWKVLAAIGIGVGILNQICNIVEYIDISSRIAAGFTGGNLPGGLITAIEKAAEKLLQDIAKGFIKLGIALIFFLASFAFDDTKLYFGCVPGLFFNTILLSISIIIGAFFLPGLSDGFPGYAILKYILLACSGVKWAVTMYHWYAFLSDNDDDGISNIDEEYGKWNIWVYDKNKNEVVIEVGKLDKDNPDTDGDGLWDYSELNPQGGSTGGGDMGYYVTNPTKKDTDGDGIWDGYFSDGDTYEDPNGVPHIYGETSWIGGYSISGDPQSNFYYAPYTNPLIKW